MGGKGGIRAGKRKRALRLACIVRGGHRESCATQRRQVVILQHLTIQMDSDCEGMWGELGEGENLVNIMFFL